MKLQCTQENLNTALNLITHIASRNATLPILNNVLIQADDGRIKLSATNLELGITSVVRGKVEQGGAYTVQSRLLADYIALLPREKVSLELEGGTHDLLRVRCLNFSTKIKGLVAAEFPLIPTVDQRMRYSLPVAALREAISQVIFAVTPSETRPELAGVLLHFTDSSLTLAATDSYRLAERKITLPSLAAAGAQRIIVPARTLQELLRVLGAVRDLAELEAGPTVTVTVAENQILFAVGGVELTSRLIVGQYPDYRQIIPQDANSRVTVSTAELTKAVKTASLFARSGIYDVSLEFIPSSGEVVVSSANSQLGENVARLSASVSGAPGQIVLNYRYLLDGLSSMGTEDVEFAVVDAASPCVLRPHGHDGHLYLIMPIKQ